MSEKVIVITGPTACGKSDVAVELALRYNGEVISADSMQIYKGMDIGTGKISSAEMRGIKHHMIDIVEPGDKFSVAEYKHRSEAVIGDVLARGKQPIVCGGTGLYIDALIRNIQFDEVTEDSDYRMELRTIAQSSSNSVLMKILAEKDPESAARIHVNNTKALIRALEVCHSTGRPFSEVRDNAVGIKSAFDYVLFGLHRDREKLYERINIRVESMMEKGLQKEVEQLYESGRLTETAAQSIGYKEFFEFFRNRPASQEGMAESISLSVERIKRETRRYAKRQITWFKRYKDIITIDCSDITLAAAADNISRIFANF